MQPEPAAAPADKPLACDESRWLPGEASTRRYARLLRLHRYDLPSAVAMVFARGTPPEEVRRVERSTRLLAHAGVPVPAIYDSDPARGWILQEDLGDVSLAAALAEGQPAEDLYAEALSLLPRLAALGRLDTSPDPPLDALRLRRELDLFVTAALDLEGPPGAGLQHDLQRLVEACCATSRVLCHRDYHARNLLWHGGRLRVIDHQDALPGPCAYDTLSLAYDPYVNLPDAFRDRLADGAEGRVPVAVQRLCKAIGTYASKGGAWRQWIAPAARQARRLLREAGPPLPVLEAALAPLAVARP
jgi:aminoglycoside/choline kinase family phosphotransferase